jgi:hypothetical protein
MIAPSRGHSDAAVLGDGSALVGALTVGGGNRSRIETCVFTVNASGDHFAALKMKPSAKAHPIDVNGALVWIDRVESGKPVIGAALYHLREMQTCDLPALGHIKSRHFLSMCPLDRQAGEKPLERAAPFLVGKYIEPADILSRAYAYVAMVEYPGWRFELATGIATARVETGRY